MKHLKLFETETDYNSATSEFEYPTVSLVQDVDEVRYMTLPTKTISIRTQGAAFLLGSYPITMTVDNVTQELTSAGYTTTVPVGSSFTIKFDSTGIYDLKLYIDNVQQSISNSNSWGTHRYHSQKSETFAFTNIQGDILFELTPLGFEGDNDF